MARRPKVTLNMKKRACRFTEEGVVYIDFRKVKVLNRYVTDTGSIIPRRTSGTSAKMQRQLSTAIKRARHLALMPYASKAAR